MRESLLGKLVMVLSRATPEELAATYRFATGEPLGSAEMGIESNRRGVLKERLLGVDWPIARGEANLCRIREVFVKSSHACKRLYLRALLHFRRGRS